MEQKISFPVRFFGSWFSPRRMMTARTHFNWFQIVIMFIFLTAIMTIPIPYFYNRQTNYNLKPFMPVIDRMAAAKPMQTAINQYKFVDQRFQGLHHQVVSQNRQSISGFNLSAQEIQQHRDVLALSANQMYVKVGPNHFSAKYYSQTNPSQNAHQFIVESWYQSNRTMIMLFMLLLLGTIILATNLLLVNGAAFFLFLSRRGEANRTDIRNYREASALTMTAMGIGSLAGMISGLIHFDLTLMLTIESVSVGLVILWIYSRTHFHDLDEDSAAFL